MWDTEKVDAISVKYGNWRQPECFKSNSLTEIVRVGISERNAQIKVTDYDGV